MASAVGGFFRRCAARLGALLIAAGMAGAAWGMDAAERRSILDAARPVAARDAGQPVKIKVDVLNVDTGWAVLVGELVSPSGGSPDWEKAGQCHPALDKMLWVVLKKSAGAWKVRHIDICASEPPYWYLDSLYGGLVWPCGVYAGLDAGSEDGPLEKQCRAQRVRRRP
ncbi:UNVERIFIED_ORG: hypothetical protein ABIC43_004794 [Variovorax guangxiensis]